MNFSNFTLIVPTLNEEKNIGELIRIISDLYTGMKILVTDDGSKDQTQDIVKGSAAAELLDRRQADIHGLTASVMDAIKITQTPFFIVIDADLQHPPEKVKDIVAILLQDQADIVVATRTAVTGSWPWHRRLISNIGRILGQFSLFVRGINCHDVLSGFFAGKTEVAQNLIEQFGHRFEPAGYKVLYDLLRVTPKKLKIKETPYTFNERLRGESKISPKHLLLYFRSFFK